GAGPGSRGFASRGRSVSVELGTTALSRMPSLARSFAIALVRLRIAALFMPVATAFGWGWRPAPPATLTMRPHLRARMGGMAWRMQRAKPLSVLPKLLHHAASLSV